MYDKKLSNIQNVNNFVNYLNNNVYDRDIERRNRRIRNIMYICGTILLIKLIIRINEE